MIHHKKFNMNNKTAFTLQIIGILCIVLIVLFGDMPFLIDLIISILALLIILSIFIINSLSYSIEFNNDKAIINGTFRKEKIVNYNSIIFIDHIDFDDRSYTSNDFLKLNDVSDGVFFLGSESEEKVSFTFLRNNQNTFCVITSFNDNDSYLRDMKNNSSNLKVHEKIHINNLPKILGGY